MDLTGQLLMPWGTPPPAPCADVEAAIAGVPKAATHCTATRAAQVLGCHKKTIHNMIDEGRLLTHLVNVNPDAQRAHKRIVVRLDRPFDPKRKHFLTLEEAARVRSNVEASHNERKDQQP